MKIAQILFPVILIFVIIIVRNYNKFISKILSRFFFAVFLITFIIFCADPNITVGIAHFIGIGRGADLVFYMTSLALVALSGIVFLKDQKQDQKFASVIRAIAINEFRERNSESQ